MKDPFPPEEKPKKSLYIISFSESNGKIHYIKIGISINPKNRFHQLQSSTPFDLTKDYQKELSNAYEVEQMTLREFSNYGIRGEWLMVINKSDSRDTQAFRHDIDKFKNKVIRFVEKEGVE